MMTHPILVVQMPIIPQSGIIIVTTLVTMNCIVKVGQH